MRNRNVIENTSPLSLERRWHGQQIEVRGRTNESERESLTTVNKTHAH